MTKSGPDPTIVKEGESFELTCEVDNDYEYCFGLILIQIKTKYGVFRSHKFFITTQKNIACHYFHYTKQIPRPFHLI